MVGSAMVHPVPVAVSLVIVVLAGCLGTGEPDPPAEDVVPEVDLSLPINLTIENLMSFRESVVAPAVGTATDLYEPTMEVSDTGTIYVAAHVILAATTGTPAYFSNDDGATWEQLPFFATLQLPSPVQGSQPPPGDEGFIVAGDDGQAWMSDIYAAGYTITGWCDNGGRQCYDNRWAYDRVESTTTFCGTPSAASSNAGSLNDRPWAAYAAGSLLLVNNPGGGPMQIGIMDVPPAQEVGVGGGMASVNGPEWNLCASPGGSIPGIPAMRDDGLFAVPQMYLGGNRTILNVVLGNKADISDVEVRKAFNVTSVGEGTINVGHAAFDGDGTLYVGAMNNTKDLENSTSGSGLLASGRTVVRHGQFILAVSADGGQTFQNATFRVDSPVESLYLDGNMAGPGALLTWSQENKEEPGLGDWYVAHLSVGADGRPAVTNVTRAIEKGPAFAAHVMGAAAGPDGRAYFVTFQDGSPAEYAGSTPLSVWVQEEGPRLPVVART